VLAVCHIGNENRNFIFDILKNPSAPPLSARGRGTAELRLLPRKNCVKVYLQFAILEMKTVICDILKNLSSDPKRSHHGQVRHQVFKIIPWTLFYESHPMSNLISKDANVL
jgi:hypothetical protein